MGLTSIYVVHDMFQRGIKSPAIQLSRIRKKQVRILGILSSPADIFDEG